MTRIVFDPPALAALLDSERGPVGRDLARRAVQVDATAKRICPVDTGRLRSSITWDVGEDDLGLVATIGSDVEYAPHVELGTSRSPAQPFLRPALRGAR